MAECFRNPYPPFSQLLNLWLSRSFVEFSHFFPPLNLVNFCPFQFRGQCQIGKTYTHMYTHVLEYTHVHTCVCTRIHVHIDARVPLRACLHTHLPFPPAFCLVHLISPNLSEFHTLIHLFLASLLSSGILSFPRHRHVPVLSFVLSRQ